MPHPHELKLSLLIDAPRGAVYRCWLEPDLVTQWFTPAPWTTPHAEIDARVGGTSYIVMQSPEGERHDNYGVFLELVPNEKIVITDAFKEAWVPSGKAFMTTILELSNENDKTRYNATVRHWSAEDKAGHEAMGFEQGWTAAAKQLEAVAKSL